MKAGGEPFEGLDLAALYPTSSSSIDFAKAVRLTPRLRDMASASKPPDFGKRRSGRRTLVLLRVRTPVAAFVGRLGDTG